MVAEASSTRRSRARAGPALETNTSTETVIAPFWRTHLRVASPGSASDVMSARVFHPAPASGAISAGFGQARRTARSASGAVGMALNPTLPLNSSTRVLLVIAGPLEVDAQPPSRY